VQQRTEALRDFPSGAPSTQAIPKNFKNVQVQEHPLLFCNRPPESTSLPVALFHPILGQFIDDARDSLPTPTDNKFSSDLSFHMSGFFDSENARADKFRDLMVEHYGIQLVAAQLPGSHYKTDGHICVNRYPAILSEAKWDMGSTQADAHLQSLLYYVNFMKRYACNVAESSMPCLHIIYFGSLTINLSHSSTILIYH
jgi:hypothetical protein